MLLIWCKKVQNQQQEQFPSQSLQHDFFPPERRICLMERKKAIHTIARIIIEIVFTGLLYYILERKQYMPLRIGIP